MRRLAPGIAILVILLAGLAGCMSAGRGPGPVAAFVIPAAANPGLPQDLVATVSPGGEPRDVYLVVPVGTNVHALVANLSLTAEAVITVISTGSRVVQQNGVTPNDFSVPVLYSIEVSGEKEPWRYRVIVRETDTNPRLGQLVLPPGSLLTPVFAPAVRAYRLAVPFESVSVRIEARAQSRFARSITVNGKETPGPAGAADVDFTGVRLKPVTIETLAEDGATRDRYVVTIVRSAPDSNALLGSLDLQGVPFSPAFSPAQLGYQAIVPFETQSIIVRARSQSRVATVSLTSAVAISGGRTTAAPLSWSGDPAAAAGAVVDFSQGAGLPLVVAVTAQDGSIQQYLIDIRRAPPDSNNLLADLSLGIGGTGLALAPQFSPTRGTYTVIVPFSTQQVRVIAHPQSRVATLQLGGGIPGRGPLTFRGNPMAPDGAVVDVPPGADRVPLLFTVTAQDGGAIRYIVELRRAAPDHNADLASLTASAGTFSPPFTPRTLAYFLALPANVDNVKLTALPAGPGALVAIAEQPGIAPAPGISYVLSVPPGGQAAVGFVVRAEDGYQRRYQIQLTRPLPPAPAVQAPVQPAQPQPAPVQPVPVQPAPTQQAPQPPQRPAPAQPQPAPAQPAPPQPAPAQPAPAQPAPTPPAAAGPDHLTLSAQDVPLPVPAGAGLLDAPTKAGTLTVRPYRSNEVILQTQVPVDIHAQGGKRVFSLQYQSPGVSLGRNRLIEFEFAVPTLGGHFFYYKEAVPADSQENLTVPFLVFSNTASIPWPAVGSPVQTAGYVSMVPPGKAERAEDKEAFQKNEKGEYGIEIQITDAKTGKPLGKDTVWRKPGLVRGQSLRFAAPMGVPEGSTVSYVLTARVPNGRTWTAVGQTQVWTTKLRADGGFEPVLLPVGDELVPGSDDKGDKGDKGDRGDKDRDKGDKDRDKGDKDRDKGGGKKP